MKALEKITLRIILAGLLLAIAFAMMVYNSPFDTLHTVKFWGAILLASILLSTDAILDRIDRL